VIVLALLAAAAAPMTPPAAGDIVVVAEKLRKIRLSADSDDQGRITACRVTVSSGDAKLDEQACEATRACAAAGARSGDTVADCVDGRMIAFATGGRPDLNEKRN
jgi:TonB family protein